MFNVFLYDPNIEDGLPVLDENLNQSAWLVKEDVVLDGKLYKKDSWIVAIRKENEVYYANLHNTLVNFSDKTDSYITEPGWYTKVRVNNIGEIVDASNIDSEDLPQHTHSVENIDNLKSKVIEIVKRLFNSDENESAINFTYDEEAEAFFADVKIDEETIHKNMYGQLYSEGAEYNGGASSVDEETVRRLQQDILNVLNQQTHNVFSEEGFTTEAVGDNTYRVTLKVDEDLITYNQNRELTLNPTFIESLRNSALDENYGNTCNQEVTLEDLQGIEGIQEWLQNQVSSLLQFNIVDYIDETTIQVNRTTGKIEAVTTNVKTHKHEIEDVKGLQDWLIWAANQSLNKNTENDFSEGYFDLTTSNLGTAIALINNLLKEYKDKIQFLEHSVGKAVPNEPSPNPGVLNIVEATKVECINVNTLKEVECLKDVKIKLNKVYPMEGNLQFYIDDVLFEDVQLNILQENDFITPTLQYKGLEDYFGEVDVYKGFYYSGVFELNIKLEEGPHTIKTVRTYNGQQYYSNIINFNYFSPLSKNITLDVTQPIKDKKISGVECSSNNKASCVFTVHNAYSNCYIPKDFKYVVKGAIGDTLINFDKNCGFVNNNLVIDNLNISLPTEDVCNYSFNATYSDKYTLQISNTTPLYTYYPYSELEENYRLNYEVYGENNEEINYTNFDAFNSNNYLENTSEIQIVGDFAQNLNYTWNNTKENCKWVSLKIPCNAKNLAHFTFEAINKKGEAVNLNKVYIALVKEDKIVGTLDGSKEYNFKNQTFYELTPSRIYLTDTIKCFTLGKNTTLKDIEYVILKIGLQQGNNLNLKHLIETFNKAS